MASKRLEDNESFIRDVLFFNPNQMMNIMTSSMSQDEDNKSVRKGLEEILK